MEDGEDGLCCSSSTIQTQLGPSSLLEERSEIPMFLLFLLCCRLPLKLRSMTGVSRLDRIRNEVVRARTGVRRELAARVDMNVLDGSVM